MYSNCIWEWMNCKQLFLLGVKITWGEGGYNRKESFSFHWGSLLNVSINSPIGFWKHSIFCNKTLICSVENYSSKYYWNTGYQTTQLNYFLKNENKKLRNTIFIFTKTYFEESIWVVEPFRAKFIQKSIIEVYFLKKCIFLSRFDLKSLKLYRICW